MIIVDREEMQRTDRSGRTKEELLRSFYKEGWYDFNEFRDSQDWTQIKTFETDPEKSFVGDKLKIHDIDDLHPAKERLITWLCDSLKNEPITYYEFGVRHGTSMRWVTETQTHPDSRFYGFDTFEGLPEDWIPFWGANGIGGGATKGMMDAKQPKIGDERVKLYKGLFQKTLPICLKEHPPKNRLFINIDCDIYSGALFVLTSMHPYLKYDDYVYMDEFFDLLNEFAAFNDYVRAYYVKDKYRLIGRAYDGHLFQFTD